jgi:hypothetical protein
MPVLESQPEATDAPLARFPAPPQGDQQPPPSTLDTWAAAERTGNVVGQLYSRYANETLFPAGQRDPNFNPIDHIPQGYLHDYGSRFLHAGNPEQIAQIKREIDDERSDQGIIARSGGMGIAASLAAGATDPLTLATMALVPEAAPTRLGNMLRWGLTNAAATGVQELASQSLSETRTARESLLNVGAGAVLGGLLGSIARRVPEETLTRLRTNLAPELKGEGETVLGPLQRSAVEAVGDAQIERNRRFLEAPLGIDHPLPGEPAYVNPESASTAGAAAVEEPTKEGLTTGRGAQTLTATVGQVTPGGRLIGSESVQARKLLTELANIPGNLEQNYKGVKSPNPIERILWGYDGLNVQGMQARRAAYGSYAARMQQQGQQAMSRRDFMEGVASAMRRGDESPIPEIAKAASWTREHIFNPLFERAQKLGLVPADVKLYADSYLTRQYDPQKIHANYGQWIDTLREGFRRQGVDPAEATDIAHAVSRNVLGAERGMMDWHALDGIVPKAGQMKERTLALPDTLLEPFLNNDIDHLSHSYLRSMAPEVEMTERFGSRDLKDQIGAITDEYAHMIEQARAEGDAKRMTELDKARDADIRDLSAIRDRLYGTYGAPKDPGHFFVRAGRLMRQVNALRLLGAATLAHFPDLANVITRYGMPNTFAAMAKFATSMQASKLALREAQRMGAAIDMTMNMSASLLGDYGTHSRYLEQRIGAGLARAFTIGTGETPLITLTQAMTSTLAQDEILRTAERVAAGRGLNENLAAKLAAAGLDEDMLKRIAAEGEQNTHRVNGLRFGMSDTWKDKAAARAFESAVLREAHGVTLRPGVGDTPLFMSKEWGKSVAQFKSFAFSASRVVAMPIMQGVAHGDLRTAEALTALVAMGTLSYVAKQKAAGQPIETNPGRLTGEILDKSNLLGWTGELLFPALWMAGFKDFSRWSDRSPAETLGGPTVGSLFEAWGHQYPARLANLASGGQALPGQENLPFRRSDLHFLRRMAPGQNVWYMRRGINALEDGIGDLFDLPGESNAERQLTAEQKAESRAP